MRPLVANTRSKYWLAQFTDCEENPLPRLEAVIYASFPNLREARIVLQKEGASDAEEGEDNDGEGDEGTGLYQCNVSVRIGRPKASELLRLAIVSDGQHVLEPWSFEALNREEFDQQKATGMFEDGRATEVLVESK
ncbi:hypothetical protein MRB53_038346 [Persea americana]|nr:hypothetical protein MRB53_038346 [Persea americana]